MILLVSETDINKIWLPEKNTNLNDAWVLSCQYQWVSTSLINHDINRTLFGLKYQYRYCIIHIFGGKSLKKKKHCKRHNWPTALSTLTPATPLVTPLLEHRKCWGKTILPRARYRLGTYRTVDIFNFSLISWAILEKLHFLCFYIIKSMARKGYFGPKYP